MIISNDPLINTSTIQGLINDASYINDKRVLLPAGKIDYTTLYFFYDPVLNPGFNPNTRQGQITLIGAGNLEISQAKNKKYEAGTILYSINVDSPGFIVAKESLGHGDSPWKIRKFSCKDITLVGKNNGFVVEAVGCPELSFENCSIIQENISGSGIKAHATWYGIFRRTHISSPLSKVASGIALDVGSTGWGGLFDLVDGCSLSFFNTGIRYQGEAAFVNFNITGCALQDNGTAIDIASRLISLNLTNLHLERNNTDIFSTGKLHNLRIDGYYASGPRPDPHRHIVLSGGVRNVNARAIVLRSSSANFIEANSVPNSENCTVRVENIDRWDDTPQIFTKDIEAITDNGSGIVRATILNHELPTGRKVEIRNIMDLDGIYCIQVIDADTIDLIASIVPLGNYNGLGKATLLCYAVRPLDSKLAVSALGCTGEYKIGYSHIKGEDSSCRS